MSEQKHTPGPWYCIPGEVDYVREEYTDACIARVFEDNGHADERGREDLPQEANARLIAAAPELLEALKSLLVATEFAMTTPSCPEKGTVVPAEMSKEQYEQKRVVKAARAAIAKAAGGVS